MFSLFAPRIGLKELAGLCHRLSTGLAAGVDVRKVMARERDAAQGSTRGPLTAISLSVDRGGTLTEAVAETDGYFPALFREMVSVGEQSGQLPEVFRQLSQNYDYQIQMRRVFVSAITWPMVQLAAALGIVGLLIWIMGIMPKMADGKPLDLLGFGLIGTSGLIKYLVLLGVIAAGLSLVYRAVRRGALWAQPVQRVLLRLPQIGRALQTLALARLAWSLHVTLNTGMELRQAIRLSMASTHNVYYTSHIDEVWTTIRTGSDLYEALARTGVFPLDFLDAIQVGEQSGQLVESMGRLSRQYQEEARGAIHTLTVIGGFLVWAMVAGLIIMVIFRLAGFYIGVLNDAARM